HLRAWAHAAGLRDMTLGATPWVYATDGLASWWGRSWADRATSSAFATQALDGGLATARELDEIRAAWLAFSEHPDAWFSMLHGELLARVA
ncbi:MAG: SAM-dependent methyltransferase, partial [Pseudoclavibacter sp.]